MMNEIRKKINLLSDGELYRDAINLAEIYKHPKYPTKTQLSGLENITHSNEFEDIKKFVENKLDRLVREKERNSNDRLDQVIGLYERLSSYLQSLDKKVEDYQLVIIPENATRKERAQFKEEKKKYIYLLAKEFIQHLVAEINYQRSY